MRKFSIVLSFLLSVTAFASGANALSYTFEDVSSDAWYYDYVQLLAKDGVIDTAPLYRPEDGLNRAELIKMVMTATNGLEGHIPPPNPTFDDVLPGEWYTNYIEAAATKGIVYGYTDENGNLTGKFGPNDTVTRAEAAKILVNAFEISTALDLSSVFPDVKSDDWFHDYIMTAYNESILDGYENGYFGPGDPVTRAQIAKLIVNAQDPVERSDDSLRNEDVSPGFLDDPEEVVTETSEAPTAPLPPEATANPLSIEEANVAASSNEVFVASYNFRALYEGFTVETVTVTNDITGDKLGDQTVGTPVIKNVVVKYPDKDGLLATASAPLGSDGKARFTGLSFFVPRDKDQFFEVYADLNKFSDLGEALSGEVLRLGLQDINNTDTSFRAIGEFSDTVVGYNGSRLSITASQAPLFTYRQSVPRFSLNDSQENLIGGQNTLISFDVSADEAGSIGLARLVFELSVSDNDDTGLNLSDFKFYRGSRSISDVMIYDATGGQDLTQGSGGSLTDGLSYVIVTFDQEETVSGGSSLTYSLRASALGVQHKDSINTHLATGDEETPLSGLTATNQGNTGKVYVNTNATAGIFTSASDFSQSLLTGRNIIWSDKSADLHLYPDVSGGLVTDASGSYDWTNGYRLGLFGLSYYIISK